MKKIICMLLLVQSGFMMAQTETVVTPNGKKVTFYPDAPGTADNGLTITNFNVQLGGALTKASILTTTSVNTLAVQGLQTGVKADNIVTLDANGVLRKITNNSWDINGNDGTIAGTNFIGTTDNQDLVFKRYGIKSGRIGESNTAFGYFTLNNSTNGGNVAIGGFVLNANTSGSNNTGVGSQALSNNTIGVGNVAVGSGTLYTAINSNHNTVVGSSSMNHLVTGDDNTVIGYSAGENIQGQIGNSLTKISQSVILGSGAVVPADNSTNQIVIGYGAVGRGSNTVQIGNGFVTSIGGAVNWSIGSDVRLKKDIVTSTYGLNFISKLRPVTYKMKIGPTGLQSGFIAQEVEAAANGIGYEFNGIVKPQNDSDFYSLRYAEFVVPLVKAVQEQQSQIDTLQKELNDLKAVVQKLVDKK